MASVYDSIAAAPVFESMAPEHLRLIAAGAKELNVPAGMLVLERGEPAERFFVICDGIVALEIDSPGEGAVRLLTLHDGDAVGWSWLFAPYRWEADGRAITDCRLIAVDGVRLRERFEADPRLAYAIAARFGADALQRARDSWYQIIDLTVRDA
jgi:CRP/FNR family transcriptional regulator, cyclic AMP receptor protein